MFIYVMVYQHLRLDNILTLEYINVNEQPQYILTSYVMLYVDNHCRFTK